MPLPTNRTATPTSVEALNAYTETLRACGAWSYIAPSVMPINEGETAMPLPTPPLQVSETTVVVTDSQKAQAKFAILPEEWKQLSIGCRIGLVEAAALLERPNTTEFVQGVYMVMGTTPDGENVENLIGAANKEDALRRFSDYCGVDEWEYGPYIYHVPARPRQMGYIAWREATV